MIRPDTIIRSNRKTLSISVDVYNRLIVRAPKHCSEERIFAFLQAKESWILRKKRERALSSMQFPSENLDGYTLLLLGKERTLRVVERAFVGFDENTDEILLPSNQPKQRLIKWLKENARRIFTRITEEKAKQMGTSYDSVSVSAAKTRWGSCSADNRLRYSFRLLYAPKEVIEYVAVHELAHTRYKNHSRLFWAEVEKYLPEWKTHRKWLKAHAALMEIF